MGRLCNRRRYWADRHLGRRAGARSGQCRIIRASERCRMLTVRSHRVPPLGLGWDHEGVRAVRRPGDCRFSSSARLNRAPRRTLPALTLDLQLPPAGSRQRIGLRASIALGCAPFRLDPSAHPEAMQRRIQRPVVDTEFVDVHVREIPRQTRSRVRSDREPLRRPDTWGHACGGERSEVVDIPGIDRCRIDFRRGCMNSTPSRRRFTRRGAPPVGRSMRRGARASTWQAG